MGKFKVTKTMIWKAKIRRVFYFVKSWIEAIFLKRMQINVVEFIYYDEAENITDAPLGGMGGWFGWNEPNRWHDYADRLWPSSLVYAEALKRYVIENNIRITGQEHQNGCGIPLFSDGKVATFSFRAWGDIMAAIWSDIDDKDYTYMDFYM